MPTRRKNAAAPITAGPALRKRFKVALTHAESNEAAWARAQGCTQTHLRETVLGARKGRALLQRVIDWTLAQEVTMRRQMADATPKVA